MKNVLYIFEINNNLLSIIIFDRKKFKIYFENLSIQIIDKITKKTITKRQIKNNLYQFTNTTTNKILIINKKIFNNKIFRKIYKKLEYIDIYRLKNLYLYTDEVDIINISKSFQYDIYNKIKMVK